MAGDFDDRLQALSDKVDTNWLAVQEQLRVVSDSLLRHGVSLSKLERGQEGIKGRLDGLDEGQGRLETALADQSRLLGQILERLPPPSDA